MTERREVPRETNPLVIALAEVALAVAERRREVETRRAKMAEVGANTRGGRAA